MKENCSILEIKRMEIAESALEARVLFEKILTGEKGSMIKKCEEFEILISEARKTLEN